MSTLIEAVNLGRLFGAVRAVDGISFKVNKGEVLGFLGPNGAGKSTTMKLLTGFLIPSFGTAKVAGYDVQEQSRLVRSLVGYLPENAPLYSDMTVRDFLRFVADVRGISDRKQAAAVERVLNLASLTEVVNKRIETLSKGFKRRVGLAQAIIHDPEILIMDEPTDGLDPNQKHEVRELILSMSASKAIILSTHILEEVDEVCTRAIIIARGKIVADGTPDELRAHTSASRVLILGVAQAIAQEASGVLAAEPGVDRVRVKKAGSGRAFLEVFPKGEANILRSVLSRMDERAWAVSEFKFEAGQLDEVFRNITH